MNLNSAETVRNIMKLNRLGFNKSYGQNFLVDEDVLCKIIESVKGSSCGYVFEIGTGLGVLTRALADIAEKVVSVEIDHKLFETAGRNFSGCSNVTLVNDDILKMNLSDLHEKFGSDRFQVAANLPYYISTPIIMKLLENCSSIERITVMVQKEVADRLKADEKSKNYGVLSVITAYYAYAEVLTYVSPESFVPSPKVWSAVVKITPKPCDMRDFPDEKKLFSVIKSGFANRRKTFVNSAAAALGVEKSALAEILCDFGIDPMIRAERLSLADFKNIASLL